jgi:NDP-sugar pyrophosphorylase family protein
MKAMILAAGMGTRLRPLTDTMPKALLEIGGRPMLEWAIRYLKKYGIQELVINVHHFAEQIIHYMKRNNGFGLKYRISDESEQLLDTGGAILKASPFLSGSDPFILMGVDIMTSINLAAMFRYHQEKKPLVTLGVKNRPTSRSLLFDDEYRLIGWRDNSSGTTKGKDSHRAKHALGFSVIQIIDPLIFSLIKEQGPFSIIDLYLRLMETQRITGYRDDEAIWLEFGRTERIESTVESDEFRSVISML